jgi:hypothetical protein
MLLADATPSPGTPAPPQPITVVGQKQKKICHRDVSTGSVIPKMICMTAVESEQLTEQSLVVRERLLRAQDAAQMVKDQMDSK